MCGPAAELNGGNKKVCHFDVSAQDEALKFQSFTPRVRLAGWVRFEKEKPSKFCKICKMCENPSHF